MNKAIKAFHKAVAAAAKRRKQQARLQAIKAREQGANARLLDKTFAAFNGLRTNPLGRISRFLDQTFSPIDPKHDLQYVKEGPSWLLFRGETVIAKAQCHQDPYNNLIFWGVRESDGYYPRCSRFDMPADFEVAFGQAVARVLCSM